ncbi:hypothetical protein [Microcoleus vaginatus]|uniref:hypothetical protein n=1 Tax=Microcoleus vaginatus TaxID=119532 RepID=UPI00403F3FB0
MTGYTSPPTKNKAQPHWFVPGYARDGEGFSIHFTPAHLETLEHLLAALRIIKAQQEAMLEYTYPEPKATTHLIR